jgi:hypothetical protein
MRRKTIYRREKLNSRISVDVLNYNSFGACNYRLQMLVTTTHVTTVVTTLVTLVIITDVWLQLQITEGL